MISIIPPSGTGYVQVCNTIANKRLKELIAEAEEAYYDLHESNWKAGKFSVSDRQVLLAHWTL
jgi:hypothetical protein